MEGAFPPPAEEKEADEEMDSEGSEVPGSGVGNFMTPSRKKVIKSPFMKGTSPRVTEARSSVFAEAGKLSAQDLLRLSEQWSALVKNAKSGCGGGCVAGHGRRSNARYAVGVTFFDAKAQETKKATCLSHVVGPNRFTTGKNAAQFSGCWQSFSRPEIGGRATRHKLGSSTLRWSVLFA